MIRTWVGQIPMITSGSAPAAVVIMRLVLLKAH
jgi:hypothetical protein